MEPRLLTGAEIVSLATGRPIDGVDLHHPVVQAIQAASLTSLARSHLNDAREKGYLCLWRNHTDCSWHGSVEYIWGWWCAAMRRAEIVVIGEQEHCEARVDLASMQANWSLHALPAIGTRLAECEMGEGFLLSQDTLQIGGIDGQAALGLVRGVVGLLADSRMTVAEPLPRSQRVALALKNWLKLVIQTSEPYVSASDIDKGAMWSSEIFAELESTDVGIVCVTPENLQRPWISFEAGAVAKRVGHARVMPFLFGMDKSGIPANHPLFLFQSTTYDRADVQQMMLSLGKAGNLPVGMMDTIEQLSELLWPRLQAELDGIAKDPELQQPAKDHPSQNEMVAELLQLTRAQQSELIRIGMLLRRDRDADQLMQALVRKVAPQSEDEERPPTNIAHVLSRYYSDRDATKLRNFLVHPSSSSLSELADDLASLTDEGSQDLDADNNKSVEHTAP